MATDTPLSRLVLAATSVADDLGYVALHDLSRSLGDVTTDYRVIGGHMVTMLAARWRLGAELHRETHDVDLGLLPVVARDRGVVSRLKDLGYEQVAGDRFARSLTDIPAGLVSETGTQSPKTFIDVLIPAYTSRARESVEVSRELFATEVPGLLLALSRPSVILNLELHRLNGETLNAEISIPDEVSAVVLKALATRVRLKDTDTTDVWRCLEIAFAAGVRPSDFAGATATEGGDQVRTLFSSRLGRGMDVVTADQHLSEEAADARFTRIRALIDRVLGSP
jgi:hypothetical protein